jgi:hypothetical protein
MGHGLPCNKVEVFQAGTNLAVGLGSALVLKIYPSLLRQHFIAERLTLPLLSHRVDVPTREIVAFDGNEWS